MSTAGDLRAGASQALEDAGVAVYRVGADGAYAADELGIFHGRMPADPDRVVVVNAYARPADHQQGVQVRVRGAADDDVDADDVADAVRKALHGIHDRRWGDTDLVQLAFLNAAPMGADANGRTEVAVNFAAVTSDPSTSLVDLD